MTQAKHFETQYHLIILKLLPQRERERVKISKSFYNHWTYFNRIGAIDGKHCNIQAICCFYYGNFVWFQLENIFMPINNIKKITLLTKAMIGRACPRLDVIFNECYIWRYKDAAGPHFYGCTQRAGDNKQRTGVQTWWESTHQYEQSCHLKLLESIFCSHLQNHLAWQRGSFCLSVCHHYLFVLRFS